MALGDIWLAGPGGNCDNAGTCPNGPCGAGEITICPTPWTSTRELEFEYDPASGESVKIGGVPLSPGETTAFLRGFVTAEPKQFAYPVEYFRAEIEPGEEGDVINPDTIGAAETILEETDTRIDYQATTNYFTITGMTASVYNGAYVTRRVTKSTGQCVYNKSGELGNTGRKVYYLPSTEQWYLGNNGPNFVANAVLTADTISYSGAIGSITPPTSGSGSISYGGPISGGFDPVDAAVFRWRAIAFPAPRQFLNSEATYEDIPLEASPGVAEFQWGKDTISDQITLISNPTTRQMGTIRLTIRSACEEPPP
jgi:hypothetical protein